jgi:hypothetical protein
MPFLIIETIIKKMKYLLVILLLGFGSCRAQNIYSNAGSGVIYLKPLSSASPANLKRGSYVGPHIFGDSITHALNNFEREYVYFKSTTGGYAVEEKVVLKRNLYKNIHDYDKYISKAYESNLLSKEEATLRLGNVINTGIKLLNFDTHQLEKDIKKLDPVDFEKYLKNLRFR